MLCILLTGFLLKWHIKYYTLNIKITIGNRDNTFESTVAVDEHYTAYIDSTEVDRYIY